ncbi:RNA polymerase sigma24 factor [Actinoplanes philippinensis]|uniref:RNA polymerase sigma-70 factor, ECF subfamily n=1 Tax=Actinoplanes philippinensis TaxID=35752 RepID=A0A1I2KRE0_9ACTN|nr:RNA polymerase sigma factor [Actinoplanes philippinensis]GIE80942.1 RNA polymerase sigma24 factor [Actinoplanes philippinensis]SFF67767.1 RNA polymerase sigma-70 factor, ECF subfamily [Actinoplanes philippinensis]
MRRRRQRPIPPVSEQSSDAELLQAIAAGQTAALRLLHHRHAGWLRARLRRRCSDPDAVDAAIQDTFVAVWKDSHRYEETTADAAAWLWTIAVRRLLSTLRGPAHRWLSGPTDEIPDTATTPSAEELVLLGVEHGALGPALDRLSPELRRLIEATALDGLSVREAAKLLGIAEGTAKTRLMRARTRLRELLT